MPRGSALMDPTFRAGQGKVSAESETRFSSPRRWPSHSLLGTSGFVGLFIQTGEERAPSRCGRCQACGSGCTFTPCVMPGSEEGDPCFHVSPPPWAHLEQLGTYTPRVTTVGSFPRPVLHRGRSAVGRGGCTPGAGMFPAHLHGFL